jgi:hypothetical protein
MICAVFDPKLKETMNSTQHALGLPHFCVHPVKCLG